MDHDKLQRIVAKRVIVTLCKTPHSVGQKLPSSKLSLTGTQPDESGHTSDRASAKQTINATSVIL